jgi:nucleoside-diphosphate-sugar epimerase
MSTVLITGGAGFIGTNAAVRMIEEGHQVRILDNLSRAGVEETPHPVP